MKEIQLAELGKEDEFRIIDKEWMLVTAGKSCSDFNTMTASWGGFGILWHKNVAFLFIRPARYTWKFIEENEKLTLSFFSEEWHKALLFCGTHSGRDTDKMAQTGLTPQLTPTACVGFKQARLTVECRKLYRSMIDVDGFIDKSIAESNYGPEQGAPHQVYVVEIEKIYRQ